MRKTRPPAAAHGAQSASLFIPLLSIRLFPSHQLPTGLITIYAGQETKPLLHLWEEGMVKKHGVVLAILRPNAHAENVLEIVHTILEQLRRI